MEKDELTYKIIGCAMKVHSILGNGFQEIIYQRCLAIELGSAGLSFGREVDQTIYYKGTEVGTRRADFIVRRGRDAVAGRQAGACRPGTLVPDHIHHR